MPNGLSVLVLETDDAIQGLLRTVLRREGYETVAVRDGRKAVQLLGSREFAAFVVDVSLAPSTLEEGAFRGLGLLHYLQKNRPALLPRVIVISGLARRDMPRNLPPVSRVLRKPFDLRDFLEALSRCARHGNLSVSAVPSG